MSRQDSDDLNASTIRWMRAGVVLMALFIAMFPVYRLYEPAGRAEARANQSAFLAAQGADLFDSSCSGCHGEAGIGGIAPAVGSRDFLGLADDAQVSQLIALGMPGSEMVAYSIDFGGPLTSSQISAITTYLRSLEADAAPNPLWRTPIADGGLDGRDLFVMACARCHGPELDGVEGVAPAIGRRSDAAEESDAWITQRIRDGEDEMPRFGRILTPEQIELIVGYLREVQGGG
ncbi:MAG: c-type cytochrome [Acidimicrobiia bacterium]